MTGAIGTCTMVGAAIGFLVGGGAGDFLAIRYPNAARPAINQLSMVFAAPLYIAFLKGLPGGSPAAHAGGLQLLRTPCAREQSPDSPLHDLSQALNFPLMNTSVNFLTLWQAAS